MTFHFVFEIFLQYIIFFKNQMKKKGLPEYKLNQLLMTSESGNLENIEASTRNVSSTQIRLCMKKNNFQSLIDENLCSTKCVIYLAQNRNTLFNMNWTNIGQN